MSKISIRDLYIYPIKSTFRIQVDESEIEFSGLKHDRSFAIIDSKSRIITARENINLLKIKTKIEKDKLVLFTDPLNKIELPLLNNHKEECKEVQIFKDQMSAKIINHEINAWVSNILGESAQLVTTDQNNPRKMKSKYNGQEKDYIRFQDASAVHLITESSLEALNKRLAKPITKHHFRPNIVLKGSEAFAEDNWKTIKIGNCEFEVAIKTARCQITTMNPETIEIDQHQEPFRTLAQFRKEKNSVHFGIYLIPRKTGVIDTGDEINID